MDVAEEEFSQHHLQEGRLTTAESQVSLAGQHEVAMSRAQLAADVLDLLVWPAVGFAWAQAWPDLLVRGR